MPTLGNTPRPGYVYDTETDTWVPIGVGAHTHAYIPNTLVDAKGDIVTASANDVPAILTKGADGTVLVSDSTTSTGLAWQPYASQYAAGKNKIINGDFSIWQRGTSFSTYGYTADRFTYDPGGASVQPTISRQTFTPGSAPVSGYEGQYFYRSSWASAPTGQGYNTLLIQKIEDVRTLAGQIVTASAWIKTDSPRSFSFGLIQEFGSGGSSMVNPAGGLSYQTTSTGWVRYTMTVTVPSVSGKTIGANSNMWLFITTTSLNVAQTWDIWGLQLEAGSIATPFTTATGSIQGELAACQRYYYKIGPSDGSSSSFLYSPLGMANATTQVIITFPFPQIMRVKPTSIEYTNPRVSDGANVSTATSLILGDASSSLGSVNVNGSGFTLFRNYWMMNNSNSSIAFNAEL